MKFLVHAILSLLMKWADYRLDMSVAFTGEPPSPDFVDKIMDKLVEYA